MVEATVVVGAGLVVSALIWLRQRRDSCELGANCSHDTAEGMALIANWGRDAGTLPPGQYSSGGVALSVCLVVPGPRMGWMDSNGRIVGGAKPPVPALLCPRSALQYDPTS